MRYRIRNKGKGFTVSVEDGQNVIASASAKDMDEAVEMRQRALQDGPDALKTKKD